MSAPQWLVDGAEVIVTQSVAHGVGEVAVRRGTVGKVGRTHFTVLGVREGFSDRDDLPLVKFRVESAPCRGASDSRMTAYPPDDAAGLRKLAGAERAAAEDAVSRAFEQWRKAKQTQVYSREHDGDRAGTLYALADAVVELRGVYDAQGIVASQTIVD